VQFLVENALKFSSLSNETSSKQAFKNYLGEGIMLYFYITKKIKKEKIKKEN